MTSRLARTLALTAVFVLGISWAASASSTIASFASASGASSAPASAGRPAPSSAALAVTAVTTQTAGLPAATVPADFEAVMGYQPRVRNGLLVDPEGTCSSPVPLPEGFAPACAEHDLGYDLLRYAALTGHPLGAWARTAIDDRLWQRMQAECAERHSWLQWAACSAAAQISVLTVEINSVRQFRGVPEESFASLAVTGLALVAVLAALARLVGRRRGRRRDGHALPAQAVPA